MEKINKTFTREEIKAQIDKIGQLERELAALKNQQQAREDKWIRRNGIRY